MQRVRGAFYRKSKSICDGYSVLKRYSHRMLETFSVNPSHLTHRMRCVRIPLIKKCVDWVSEQRELTHEDTANAVRS